VARELRPLADEKGLRLVVAAGAEIEICTDRRAVRQILSNLTSNAIKFTDNGVVALELSQRRDEVGSVALFTVRDTGRGVTREDRDRLFDPFARIGGRDARPDGSGLGLYTSQTLAALLGGVISVQSETGSGSAFTLELSAAAGSVAKRSGR
jgi:signal transduction histidine kinase